jgi:hypothetical protein
MRSPANVRRLLDRVRGKPENGPHLKVRAVLKGGSATG